jgi:hypothetical protein
MPLLLSSVSKGVVWKMYPLTSIVLYRDIFKAIDEFTTLRFTATGASPAAKRTRILPMAQHA